MICPKCKREDAVKNGMAKGKQRYKCRHCGCNYTKSFKQGYSESIKRSAVWHYLNGYAFREIERILLVSHVSVINWVRDVFKKVNHVHEITQNKRMAKKKREAFDALSIHVQEIASQKGSHWKLNDISSEHWDTIMNLMD